MVPKSLPEVLLWEQLPPESAGRLQAGLLLPRPSRRRRVDGEMHDRGDRPAKDCSRDDRLDGRGFATSRIPARDIPRDLDAVLTAIVAFCRGSAPSTTALRAAVALHSGEE